MWRGLFQLEVVVRGSSYELRPLSQSYPSRLDLVQRPGREARLSCSGTTKGFGQGKFGGRVVRRKEPDRRAFAVSTRTAWSPYTANQRYRPTRAPPPRYDLYSVNILAWNHKRLAVGTYVLCSDVRSYRWRSCWAWGILQRKDVRSTRWIQSSMMASLPFAGTVPWR